MSEIVVHVAEHAADLVLLDPAVRVAAGIARDKVIELVGPERLKNLQDIGRRATEKLKGKKFEPPPLSVSVPLLEAARDESRVELQDLWASLLAAACDPARSNRYRRQFVDVVKQLEPLDALVLKELANGFNYSGRQADQIAGVLRRGSAEVTLSLMHLARLGCAYPENGPIEVNDLHLPALRVSTLAKELLAAVAD